MSKTKFRILFFIISFIYLFGFYPLKAKAEIGDTLPTSDDYKGSINTSYTGPCPGYYVPYTVNDAVAGNRSYDDVARYHERSHMNDMGPTYPGTGDCTCESWHTVSGGNITTWKGSSRTSSTNYYILQTSWDMWCNHRKGDENRPDDYIGEKRGGRTGSMITACEINENHRQIYTSGGTNYGQSCGRSPNGVHAPTSLVSYTGLGHISNPSVCRYCGTSMSAYYGRCGVRTTLNCNFSYKNFNMGYFNEKYFTKECTKNDQRLLIDYKSNCAITYPITFTGDIISQNTTIISKIDWYRDGIFYTTQGGNYKALNGAVLELQNVQESGHCYQAVIYYQTGPNNWQQAVTTPPIWVDCAIEVTCIDVDITSGKELGRSVYPIDTTGYIMAPGDGHLFMPYQTVSATAWGADVSKDAYYKDYFYKNGSATSRYVPDPNFDHTVYRYFYPTPIFTDQIKIEGTNIYKDPTRDKTYFVKVDTPFTTKYNSYIFNTNIKKITAPNDYMINNVFINSNHSKLSDIYNLYILNTENSKTLSKENYNLLKLNTETATRNNLKTNVELITNLQTDSEKDNKIIEIIPKATANYDSGKTKVVVSSADNKTNKDSDHNLFVICDAQAPTVKTNERFDPESTNFYPLIEDKTTITISYADFVKNVNPSKPEYGSGVNTNNIKVTLIQEQTDPEDPIYKGGPMSKVYAKDTVNKIVTIKGIDAYTGQIILDINPQEYSDMSGFITVRVEITDNVGNKLTKDFRILVMHFTTSLYNTVEKSKYYNTQSFVQGENGKIIIETNGFIDKVNFKFTQDLDNLAQQERSNAGNEDTAYWHTGRTLTNTYPCDNAGNITTVFKEMQTKLWGTENIGGMQYKDGAYEHCYLIHYFYAPLYSENGKYPVVVTVYKTDPKNEGKVYSITKTLEMQIGNSASTPDNPQDDIDSITGEFRDTITDN